MHQIIGALLHGCRVNTHTPLTHTRHSAAAHQLRQREGPFAAARPDKTTTEVPAHKIAAPSHLSGCEDEDRGPWSHLLDGCEQIVHVHIPPDAQRRNHLCTRVNAVWTVDSVANHVVTVLLKHLVSLVGRRHTLDVREGSQVKFSVPAQPDQGNAGRIVMAYVLNNDCDSWPSSAVNPT